MINLPCLDIEGAVVSHAGLAFIDPSPERGMNAIRKTKGGPSTTWMGNLGEQLGRSYYRWLMRNAQN